MQETSGRLVMQWNEKHMIWSPSRGAVRGRYLAGLKRRPALEIARLNERTHSGSMGLGSQNAMAKDVVASSRSLEALDNVATNAKRRPGEVRAWKRKPLSGGWRPSVVRTARSSAGGGCAEHFGHADRSRGRNGGQGAEAGDRRSRGRRGRPPEADMRRTLETAPDIRTWSLRDSAGGELAGDGARPSNHASAKKIARSNKQSDFAVIPLPDGMSALISANACEKARRTRLYCI